MYNVIAFVGLVMHKLSQYEVGRYDLPLFNAIINAIVLKNNKK